MYRGYTKRWRKRWDKGYHKDPLLFLLMDYFIDFANYEDKEFPFIWKGKLIEMVKVKRGQHFFTVKGLTEFLRNPRNKLSRKIVRGRLATMKRIDFLDIQSTHHYSIATVLKYDIYNPLLNSEGQPIGPPTDPPKAHQPTHQKTTPNKDKKVKKVNNTHACVWPKDFSLTEKMRSYANEKGIVKVDAFFDDFRDWAFAKGATYKDWQAAFRIRVGKAPEYGKQFLSGEADSKKEYWQLTDKEKRDKDSKVFNDRFEKYKSN
jgi:hypothetical protein